MVHTDCVRVVVAVRSEDCDEVEDPVNWEPPRRPADEELGVELGCRTEVAHPPMKNLVQNLIAGPKLPTEVTVKLTPPEG